MLYATVVQVLIYRSSLCYDQPWNCGPSLINGWVQGPLYFLISAGEAFAYVTAFEYEFDHSPKEMKVVVQAIDLLIGGVASACAMASTAVARDPYLFFFYGSLSGGMPVTTVVFWLLLRRYNMPQAETRDKTDRDEVVNHILCDATNRGLRTAPCLDPIWSIVVRSRNTSFRQALRMSLSPCTRHLDGRRQVKVISEYITVCLCQGCLGPYIVVIG